LSVGGLGRLFQTLKVKTARVQGTTVNAVNDKAARDTAIEAVDIPASFITRNITITTPLPTS
jgi:hypothetical protein